MDCLGPPSPNLAWGVAWGLVGRTLVGTASLAGRLEACLELVGEQGEGGYSDRPPLLPSREVCLGVVVVVVLGLLELASSRHQVSLRYQISNSFEAYVLGFQVVWVAG